LPSGGKGHGTNRPESVVIFDVELVSIEKAEKAEKPAKKENKKN
jgi:hypothetical protein